MALNDAAIALIKSHEGLRLEAYADPGYGWDVATIGYGHTSAAGPPKVTRGLKITEADAEAILRQDLVAVESRVRSLVTVPLNDNQLGALVSFTFNIGATAFAKSTLLRLLNKGDYAGAAAQFKRWNKSNGKVLKGLTRRRADEAALFSGLPDSLREALRPSGGVATPANPPVPRPEAPAAPTGLVAIIIAALIAIGGAIIAFFQNGATP